MDFRRNGLRDERRRRVLIDESLHGGAATASTGAAGGESGEAARSPVKSYSDAALASSQMPVTAFLPKHPLITWSVWFAGLATIVGILLLHHFAYQAASNELRTSLVALDLAARGSLASWFTAVVLGASAFASLLVFQIRRHRTDDYRGRYRCWLWLVPLLFAASISASTGLHDALSGILKSVTGHELAAGGKGWWLLAYAAVFLPIVLQLSIELWPSRLATFFYCVTSAMYLGVILLEFNVLPISASTHLLLYQSGLLLAAHLGVLVTVLAYGRYVYLDAHGRLTPRKRWVRKSKAKKPKAVAKVDSAQVSPRPNQNVRVDDGHTRLGKESVPSAVADSDDNADDDEADGANRKLSKAERRRMRKESQRERE